LKNLPGDIQARGMKKDRRNNLHQNTPSAILLMVSTSPLYYGAGRKPLSFSVLWIGKTVFSLIFAGVLLSVKIIVICGRCTSSNLGISLLTWQHSRAWSS
jgi:hypothetical protein